MQRLLSRIFLLGFAIFFLTNCAQQQFTYTPPSSSADRICIAHCSHAKNSCEQICRMKSPSCFNRADKAAYPDFLAYQSEMHRLGKPATKKLKDFADYSSCRKSCKCILSYNTCYMACGGQVKPK